MKNFAKFTTLILTLIIILSTIIIPTSAAGNATLYFSSNSVKVGDTVTVSVAINPDEAMYGVEFYLQYNDSVLKYNGGSGSENSAGVLKIVESPSGDKSVKYNFTFKAKKTGSSSISVTDCVYVTMGDSGSQKKSFTGAAASLSVKDEKLSKDATLKSLSISGYSLSPNFSSSTTSYKLKVPYDTKKINVSAKTSDSKAKVVSVDGAKDLDVGKNTVTITTEAENGTQKKYTITVTRKEKEKEESSSEEASSEEISSEEEVSSEEEPTESEETDTEPLITTISGNDYTILTEISKKYLIKGFDIEEKIVNGHEVETAVDPSSELRVFYLQSSDSKKPIPYLYDEVLDQFEKLKYITVGDNYYIFSKIPEGTYLPENLYSSNIDVSGYSVDCLTYTNPELSGLNIVYCYSNGVYDFYRYDLNQSTIQRFPDFTGEGVATEEKEDTFMNRFSKLSTNGKVIIVAIIVLILGIVALLIMLIVYLIKKSTNRYNDYYSDEYEDFEEVTIQNDNNVLK